MASTLLRVFVAFQLALSALLAASPLVAAIVSPVPARFYIIDSISEETKRKAKTGEASDCTNLCWSDAPFPADCANSGLNGENHCMCSSITNHEYFSNCVIACNVMGLCMRLSSHQTRVGFYGRTARDGHVSPSGLPLLGHSSSYGPSSPHNHATYTIPLSSSITAPLSTFTTQQKRAITERNAQPQVIGAIPWKHESKTAKHVTTATAAPSPAYTHNSVPAAIGFCGVPSSSCNDLIATSVSDSASTFTTVTHSSIIARQVHDTGFIPSLVRMCAQPDLVNCYKPLAPEVADITKAEVMPRSIGLPAPCAPSISVRTSFPTLSGGESTTAPWATSLAGHANEAHDLHHTIIPFFEQPL